MRFHPGFHRLALRELQLAVKRYRAQSPRVAERFVNAIEAAVRRIAENPQLGPEFEPGFRWGRTHKFPYLLYFQIVNDDQVRILAVAHSRRRPGYWKRRVKKS